MDTAWRRKRREDHVDGPIILRGWWHTGSCLIEVCICVCESDGDSDLSIKRMQGREMELWEIRKESGVRNRWGGGTRPENPLNIKSINRSERRREWNSENKILQKATARQKRIKKECSDDCDIDDSTVGKTGWTDGGERGRIRRLRMSDQSTPGHEREGARESGMGGRGEMRKTSVRVWGDDGGTTKE